MAGAKGKSGLKKGHTNNPNGRPVGSKNKIQLTVKKRIAEYVEDDFDTFIHEVEELDPKERVKIKLDLIKLIVPRPVNEEETDREKAFEQEFMNRLFPTKKEE